MAFIKLFLDAIAEREWILISLVIFSLMWSYFFEAVGSCC